MERDRNRYMGFLGVLVYGIIFWSVLFYIHFYQFHLMTLGVLYVALLGLFVWFGLMLAVVNNPRANERSSISPKP